MCVQWLSYKFEHDHLACLLHQNHLCGDYLHIQTMSMFLAELDDLSGRSNQGYTRGEGKGRNKKLLDFAKPLVPKLKENN